MTSSWSPTEASFILSAQSRSDSSTKLLNQSAGERVRGAIHIQTVNNRHSRFKDFLRRYRGVSSKYLGNYLRWYERCDLLKSSPRSCLATALECPRIRI